MTLDELQKLVDAATPGKWDESSWQLGQINYEDAAFIAAARTYMPLLLAVARALQFYANAGYERTVGDDLGYKWNPEEWIYNEPEILEDGGEIARKALAALEESK